MNEYRSKESEAEKIEPDSGCRKYLIAKNLLESKEKIYYFKAIFHQIIEQNPSTFDRKAKVLLL